MAQPSTFAGNGEGKVTTASALGFGNFPFVEILLRPWVPSPRTRRALNDDPLLPEKSSSEHVGYET